MLYICFRPCCSMPLPDSDLRALRHDIRGDLNTLHISVSALEILTSKADQLECVEAMDRAADNLAALMDRLMKLPAHS